MRVLGPFEFTLAHELGHWIYDADPDQGALFASPEPVVCLEGGDSTPDTVRVREMNANKFAAAILLPADLVRLADPTDLVAHHRKYAASWGVSARTLDIRLHELEITVATPPEKNRLLPP